MHLGLLWLAACRLGGESRPAPVASDVARAYALAADQPFAELSIPDHNRPGGAEPADRIPLDGPWRSLGPNKGMSRYEADLPVRPRGLFFHSAQPGLQVLDRDGEPLAYARGVGRAKPYWNHERETLVIAMPGERGPPERGEFTLRWPKASDRERALNFAMSGQTDRAAFVRTSVQVGWDSRQGVLVPAPGSVAWDLEVPPAGELHFAPGIVPPEVRDARASDGARLVLEVVEGGTTTEVWSAQLQSGRFSQQRVDLSRWAGRAVRLRARSEPLANADFDYVLLGEPILASRQANPRTVLLVFVDTLRPDHLSFYGYPRDTSRALTDFAAESVVFEQARSVAPWTLPSARTVLSGRQPEEYDVATTLQTALRARGWATGMIAGNVYLSPNFGMNAGWDYQHVTNWPDATEVSAQARQWLAEHDGQDRLLLVHFMDPHLPYKEPGSHRWIYAGETPTGFAEEVVLSDIKRKPLDSRQKQWVVDRYDNNVRFALDEAATVIGSVDADDIVVLFADHGEEFWEHDGFEHGHTLYDELLRVPLVIRAPGIAPRRVTAPVSLLDVTPTLLELTGATAPDLDGMSLLDAMRDVPHAGTRLGARDQAFGRPLYGSPRWGVLHDGEKWTTTEGREAWFRLGTDPGEQDNLARDGNPVAPGWPDRMGAALGREVALGWRITTGRATGALAEDDLIVRVAVPGGVAAAWAGDDPLKGSMVRVDVLSPDTATDPPTQTAVFTWMRGYHGTREVYLVPEQPIDAVTASLVFEVEYGEERSTHPVIPTRVAPTGGKRLPIVTSRLRGNRTFTVGWAWAPQPNDSTSALEGSDDELKSALEAMGYVEGRE